MFCFPHENGESVWGFDGDDGQNGFVNVGFFHVPRVFDVGVLHFDAVGPTVFAVVRNVGVLLEKRTRAQEERAEIFPHSKPPCIKLSL